MGSYTETVEISDVTVGDGFIGLTAGPVTVNGATPTPDLTRVRMVFRHGQSTYVFDSEAGADGTIVIDDADTWEASIAPTDDFLPWAGKWQWEMEFYRVGATAPWTLFKGELRVWPDLD